MLCAFARVLFVFAALLSFGAEFGLLLQVFHYLLGCGNVGDNARGNENQQVRLFRDVNAVPKQYSKKRY